MRLTRIKLSGFKSFVDPTTFRLPSALVGIVGPNGCGKSNLIDAVRWVMGESSAKQLRGESMADVIFNGSSARKPVGQASIELVFDNSDRRVTGQYAGYDEIAIRRVLQRDGQSAYYLNATRCRRRDITDIFLGTGLGPRSYSIIEQGMISRVIESSPEQLRGFLEEAAGISKYKERRRETENRIRHSRDNLNRVNDLREELGRQLERLQRQARNAERYRELKREERRLKAGVLAIRWAAERKRMSGLERDAAETQLSLDRVLASVRSYEARMEHARVALSGANDDLGQVQGRYYGAGSEVARIEQTIKHGRELRTRYEDDLRRTAASLEDLERHAEADRRHIAGLHEYLASHEPLLLEAREREESALARHRDIERKHSDWRASWDANQERVAQRQRDAEVTHTRIDHGEGQLADVSERLRRLQAELRGLSEEDHTAAIAKRRALVAELDGELLDARARVDDLEEQLQRDQSKLQTGGQELHALRERLESDQGRESSLHTLQRAALSEDQEAQMDWLATRGLESASRLAHGIRVEPGLEVALESVLSGRLDAICVAELNRLGPSAADLSGGHITLFEPAHAMEDGGEGDARGLVPLVQHVSSDWSVASLLGGVFVADSVEAALSERGRLAAHESFVTPSGARVGPDWLEWRGGEEPSRGILARARELEQVSEAIRLTREQEGRLQDELHSLDERVEEYRSSLAAEREIIQETHERRTHLSAESESLQRRAEQTAKRRERIEREMTDLEGLRKTLRNGVAESRASLERMVGDLAAANEARERYAAVGKVIEAAISQSHEVCREARARVHELSVQVESRRSSLDSLRRGIERLQEQRIELDRRREELRDQLSAGEAPLADAEKALDSALAARGALEEELAAARNAVEAADVSLRELDQGRTAAERDAERVRDTLETQRVSIGEARVRCQNLAEQLAELDMTPEDVLAEIPSDAEDDEWQAQLEGVGQRIQRLGAINLAAIDEFAREKERKEYLDAQHTDLTEALDTLESAIAKIDRETRSRFQDVYGRVNEGFGKLFPRLFGGGQAFLELVGEDVLDAGVAVMARPPGKRIANIHLLSGGEKALTAAALVFAIFQLNPAPFCMLDEVDAPLDEANVGRFCDLVREMSGQVQFIVITHNKATMEVLDQLVGVTMHEPGCSRLVAVDVDEAARLAAV